MTTQHLLFRWCTSSPATHARNSIQSIACGGLPRGILPARARNFSSTPCCRAVQSKKVVTFNPKLMDEMGQKITDISNEPHTLWRLGTKYSQHLQYAMDFHPGVFMYRKSPFPADARGFFYYFRDESMPPISGSLRFRVCEDLAAFESGHDLLTEMKEPWAIPLIRIVRDKVWATPLDYLIRDGQVEESLVRVIKKLQLPASTMRNRPLFVPTQPFSFNLKHSLLALSLITTSSTGRVDFQHLFYNRPLEGCVRLAFELVKPEPPDGPTIALRIVDILTPIKYPEDGKCRALEVGELKRWNKKQSQTWTYPLTSGVNGKAWLEFIKNTRQWCNT